MRISGMVMALALAIIGIQLAGAEDTRGLTSDEIAQGILTRSPAVAVTGGSVIDELRVSGDGRWIVYTAFTSDIRNNAVWLVSADGKTKREIDTPYGYKNTPVLWGGYERNGIRRPLTLFVSFAGKEKGGSPDGIYTRTLEPPSAQWTRWETGSYRDLSLSGDEAYLMASSGKWNTAKVRSSVHVWPLDPAGRKAGAVRVIAPELRGQVHRISMSPDNTELVFECTVDRTGAPYGVSNIYTARNESSAPATLIIEDAQHPSVRAERRGYTIFHVRGRDAVMAYATESGVGRELAVFDGFSPNGLEYDRANDRILLGVQDAYGSVAGLVTFPAR